MLLVSLDCPFLVAPLVFSNIYFYTISMVPVNMLFNLTIFLCLVPIQDLAFQRHLSWSFFFVQCFEVRGDCSFC